MLQIISGKFFRSADRHVHPAKGVLFSNYSWVGPIETVVGTLEPVDHSASIMTYVYSYNNQIEKSGNLIRTGDAEIVDQFRILCSFGLEAYFSLEKSQIEHVCRDKPRGSGDTFVPGQFIRRTFAPLIQGSFDEVTRFPLFMKRVIELKRERYVSVINCLQNVNDALDVLSYNIDLSYSMLIYCLEALCQEFDLFDPKWENYDPKTREPLDAILGSIDPTVANSVRATLLRDAHVQLMSRFLDFTMNHVSESFFMSESGTVQPALRYSQLRQALKNAYTLRSKYVHMLRPIQNHLRQGRLTSGDVFVWDNEPYLTLSGLFRLVRHVVNNFISRSDSVETEEFDWRASLPGIITMRVAPQYWIWQHQGITVPMKKEQLGPIVRDKFWGLVDHILSQPPSDRSLPDLRELLEKYESLIPQAAPIDKIRMLGTYLIYNSVIVLEARSKNWPTFYERHSKALGECSMETMFLSLFFGEELEWDLDLCIHAYDRFQKKRFSSNELRMPRDVEIALLMKFANMAFFAGRTDDFSRLLRAARLEAAGFPDLQTHLQTCESEQQAVEDAQIFSRIRGEPLARGPAQPPAPSAESPLAETQSPAEASPSGSPPPAESPPAETQPPAEASPAEASSSGSPPPAESPPTETQPAQSPPVETPTAESQPNVAEPVGADEKPPQSPDPGAEKLS